MYEIRNCAGQYSGKLHWKFLWWRNRDLDRCSEIITNTPLLFLFLYNSVLLKMADTERRWWRDSRNGCSLSPWPLQRGAAAGSGPLALPGKKAGPKGPALFAVSILKATTQAKSPLNDNLITQWMYSFQDLQSQPHQLSTWRTNSSKSPPISGFPLPSGSKPPDFLHPHQKMHFLHFFTLARHKGQHQNFHCLLRTFIPVPQQGD